MLKLFEFLRVWIPVYLMIGNIGMFIIAFASPQRWWVVYWLSASLLNLSVFMMMKLSGVLK